MVRKKQVDGSSEKCNVSRGFLIKPVVRLQGNRDSIQEVLSRHKLSCGESFCSEFLSHPPKSKTIIMA